MRDRIIAAYLKDFVERFGLTSLSEAEAFEHFVNYCVVSKHHTESFDPEDTAVGGGGDLGLDGLAILVNDHLVFSAEDVDFLKKMLRRLDVQFLFVQSKTGEHFDGADIGTFVSGVRQFFQRTLPYGTNENVSELHRLKEYIFDSTIDMDRNPVCRLCYTTTGIWANEPPLRARIDQGIEDLKNLGLFSTVEFLPLDAEGLKQIYRELHQKIVREITFEKHTILPQITGVQEAYIGIVPCLEYLKLIRNEDGTLNRRLFYDNVRDFQGHNPVNKEIEATVQDGARNDRFALLNNGITIVARDINKVGANFRLKDYQIVNGCQTSHILFLNSQHITANVYVPVKLIVTGDVEMTNQIIQGTNRQTEVLIEAFESLAPFQKKLEEFYLSIGRDRREPVYYERRSKQYDHLDIRRERIISLATQVKCFVAIFLNEPHSTHRYYGELLTSYRNRVFSEAHSPYPYFVSGEAFVALERLFVAGKLPRTWKRRRYQLLMVLRVQNGTGDLPALNSRGIDKYCEGLLHVLDDPSRCEGAFQRAGELVELVERKGAPWRETPDRTRAFTALLIEEASKGTSQLAATTDRLAGTVKWFSDVKGYGFIVCEDGSEVFVHYSNISGSGYRFLSLGQAVRFSLAQTTRGLQAVEVEAV